jgi:hypothetical protein
MKYEYIRVQVDKITEKSSTVKPPRERAMWDGFPSRRLYRQNRGVQLDFRSGVARDKTDRLLAFMKGMAQT